VRKGNLTLEEERVGEKLVAKACRLEIQENDLLKAKAEIEKTVKETGEYN